MFEQDMQQILLTPEQIHARVREIAAELERDYAGKAPLVVGVLRGAFVFLADLVRQTDLPLEVDFISASSYGAGTESSGLVDIRLDVGKDIRGRDVILVEDILDSGNTLYFLKNYFMAKGAASVTVVTLLDKPSRRTKPIVADLAGFEVPDEFVVGYGLDYAQKYRNMPYIGVLKPEVYSEN